MDNKNNPENQMREEINPYMGQIIAISKNSIKIEVLVEDSDNTDFENIQIPADMPIKINSFVVIDNGKITATDVGIDDSGKRSEKNEFLETFEEFCMEVWGQKEIPPIKLPQIVTA